MDGGRGGEGKENMHIIKKLVNYLYLTAHLDSVLRSAKFGISLEFRETSVEACTNGQFDLQNSDS